MANDNTLGAPTEGLGQTVTFASGQGAGVPQATAMQRGGLRNNSTGGAAVRTAQALQVTAPKGDTLFQTLARLGGDLIKPQLEAERTLKYVEGMQKAASGQAIEEIVNEQPFFSGLFGASSVVDGARAYSASAKATSMAVDFETNMGELRKLSPAEMSQYTASKIAEATQGGDATTNAMIVQQVSSTLPAVMKGQTKAHIRYQQELRETATGDAYTASFALVGINAQEASKDGATKTVDDVVQAGITAMNGMVRDNEIDPELHSKLVAQSAAKAIAAGNFPAYQVLEASGKLSELTADDQYRVRRAYGVAQAEAKGKLPVEFSRQVLEFKLLSTQPGSSLNGIQAKADEVNARYKKITGDHGNYLGANDVIAEQMQFDAAERQRLDRLLRERETAMTAAGKEQAQVDWVTGAFAQASNLAATSSYLIGKKPAEQQAVFDHARAVLGQEPEKHMFFVANQAEANIYDKTLESVHAAELNISLQGGSGPGLYQYYNRHYKPLVQAAGGMGQVIAQHYAGDHKDLMARYHAMASQYPNPDALQQEAFFVQARAPRPTTVGDNNKKAQAVKAELSSSTSLSLLGRVVGMDTVPLVNPGGLANLITPKLAGERDVAEEVESYKRENRDLTVLGGHYWTKQVNATRVDDWLNANPRAGGVTSSSINRALRLTIDKFANSNGIDDTPQVGQIADVNGIPQMILWGMGSDGKPKLALFSGDDVHANWAESNAPAVSTFKTGGWKPGGLTGNELSPYASQEERAAYRKANPTN